MTLHAKTDPLQKMLGSTPETALLPGIFCAFPGRKK